VSEDFSGLADEAKGVRHPRVNISGYVHARRYGTAIVVDPLEEVRQLCEAMLTLSDGEVEKAGLSEKDMAEVEYIYDLVLGFKQAYFYGSGGQKTVSLPIPYLGAVEGGPDRFEFSVKWLPLYEAERIVFMGPSKMEAVNTLLEAYPDPPIIVVKEEDEKGNLVGEPRIERDAERRLEEAYYLLDHFKDFITVESYENLRVRFVAYAMKTLLTLQRKTFKLLNQAAMESAFKR